LGLQDSFHESGISKPAVLVADDSKDMREFLADLMQSEGYRVVCADDGEQALELVRREPIDLVLSDVMMPHRSGFALCRVIKADPRTRFIPVVLVTSLESVEDRVQGIECGADDFLNKPVRKEELSARVRSLLKLKHFTDELESAETVLYSLALSIEAKDPYTKGHCERLSKYSVALAERLGLPKEQCLALRRGGIVHDIGKVAVPEHILLKPGPLTPEERRIMEQHTAIGERICAPLKSFQLVLPLIRHHHEKSDGSGYPDGLKGEDIPLTARILQTVDIFDALTTDRPYRKALTPQKAFAQMREEVKRGWWDGTLIEEFQRLLKDGQSCY
jgi:putative two-component system response regulator